MQTYTVNTVFFLNQEQGIFDLSHKPYETKSSRLVLECGPHTILEATVDVILDGVCVFLWLPSNISVSVGLATMGQSQTQGELRKGL